MMCALQWPTRPQGFGTLRELVAIEGKRERREDLEVVMRCLETRSYPDFEHEKRHILVPFHTRQISTEYHACLERCVRFNEKLETWEDTCGWVTGQVVRCINPHFLDTRKRSPAWQLAETSSFFELLGAIEENVQARVLERPQQAPTSPTRRAQRVQARSVMPGTARKVRAARPARERWRQDQRNKRRQREQRGRHWHPDQRVRSRKLRHERQGRFPGKGCQRCQQGSGGEPSPKCRGR